VFASLPSNRTCTERVGLRWGWGGTPCAQADVCNPTVTQGGKSFIGVATADGVTTFYMYDRRMKWIENTLESPADVTFEEYGNNRNHGGSSTCPAVGAPHPLVHRVSVCPIDCQVGAPQPLVHRVSVCSNGSTLPSWCTSPIGPSQACGLLCCCCRWAAAGVANLRRRALVEHSPLELGLGENLRDAASCERPTVARTCCRCR
jgi:hypothetical protein